MRKVYLLTIGLLLLVPLGYSSPAYSQYSPPVSPQTNPIETRIVIDEPTHDGLYLQNDRISSTIYFINHGDQPIDVSYSFVITHIETNRELSQLGGGFKSLQPNSNFSYPDSSGYSAGNYRIYATAFVNNTSFNDSKELFFWVATPFELYTKQALNYTLYGVVISAFIAAATIATAIWARRANERQRKDTKDYVDKQLKLQEDGNKVLQESNQLTQESLKFKQSEFKASLGKPDLEIVQTGLETSGSSPTMRLYPNFRNDGKTHARSIRIYHHIFDRVVGLEDIVKLEDQIKGTQPIEVPGSVAPGKSIQLHTANANNPSIVMQKKDKPKPTSLAVWYTYEYLDGDKDEVLFNIQYTQETADNNPTRHTSTEIAAMREKLKGKT